MAEKNECGCVWIAFKGAKSSISRIKRATKGSKAPFQGPKEEQQNSVFEKKFIKNNLNSEIQMTKVHMHERTKTFLIELLESPLCKNSLYLNMAT